MTSDFVKSSSFFHSDDCFYYCYLIPKSRFCIALITDTGDNQEMRDLHLDERTFHSRQTVIASMKKDLFCRCAVRLKAQCFLRKIVH